MQASCWRRAVLRSSRVFDERLRNARHYHNCAQRGRFGSGLAGSWQEPLGRDQPGIFEREVMFSFFYRNTELQGIKCCGEYESVARDASDLPHMLTTLAAQSWRPITLE